MSTSGTSSAMAAQSVALPVAGKKISGAATTLNEKDFLALLTQELKDQDPLNPMKGAAFAAQLANFSTASGVQDLNTKMTKMSGAIDTATAVQGAGLVGHNVAVNGDALVVPTSGSVQGAFDLSAPGADVKVKVLDSSGTEVANMDLGAMPAGFGSFQWDGVESNGSRAAPGVYTMRIAAADAQGNAVNANPYTVAAIKAIEPGSGGSGTKVDLVDGLPPATLSDIQRIF